MPHERGAVGFWPINGAPFTLLRPQSKHGQELQIKIETAICRGAECVLQGQGNIYRCKNVTFGVYLASTYKYGVSPWRLDGETTGGAEKYLGYVMSSVTVFDRRPILCPLCYRY